MELDLDELAMTPEDVGRLLRPERERRVTALVDEAHAILLDGMDRHVLADGRKVAAIVTLFSGGNDSTTLAHIFRRTATHAAHANTTIGVERTREYVRNVCEEWGLPLLERTPPRIDDQYRALVLDQGFPGPGHHYKMFQRLKERALRQVQRELVGNPRKERVIFLAGRRRTESKRRANIPEFERLGSCVWISPLVNWTKPDMNTYRIMQGDVPRNEVSDLIHMSGECLCGAFASPGERGELELWFNGSLDLIRELEELLKPRADMPDYRKTWGWGAIPELLAQAKKREKKPSKTGPLCDACAVKVEEMEGAAA
jgi:3'-phosphoadenosine 5'-phosphosulfate sulfotransferase (PAPS reductase)/FAD synthetase